MRSALLVLLTVLLLAVVFAIYATVQPKSSSGNQPSQYTFKPTTVPSAMLNDDSKAPTFRSGDAPWVQEFSETTGQLSSQFRAAKYEPTPNHGPVNVTLPEAEFFLGADKSARPGAPRRVLRVQGKTGQVITTNSAKRQRSVINLGGQQSMPSRGTLQDVTITLYDSEAELEAGAPPVLTARMNNAAFDNDTFRVYTESFTAPDGRTVPADQVPVTVRGRDVDFDGYGLIIRMDELDRSLRSLEVVHGKSLTIKNPKMLSKSSGPQAMAAPVGAGFARRLLPPLPVELAAADENAPAAALTRPASTRPRNPRGNRQQQMRRRQPPKPVPSTAQASTGTYRATFYDSVHVTQGPATTIDAARLEVDFLMKSSQEGSASQPATVPATLPAKPATMAAAQNASTAQAEAPQPAAGTRPAEAAAQPATHPTPINVTWTGRLLILPAPPEVALDRDESVVHFIGAPVTVHQKDSTVTCADVVYDTAAQTVVLRDSPAVPLTLTDGKGATVHSRLIRYIVPEHAASLEGRSDLVTPVTDNGRPAGTMTARWSKSCDMTFLPAAGAAAASTAGEPQGGASPVPDLPNLTLESLSMTGDVDVQHPKLSLQSQSLDLTFAPSIKPAAAATAPDRPAATTTKPASDMSSNLAFKTVDAAGAVSCILRDTTPTTAPTQPLARSIDCDKLHLESAPTPAGTLAPRKLVATGHVHAVDAGSDLRAAHMTVLLAQRAGASTQPSGAADLEQLTAEDHVVVTQAKSGAKITGRSLFVDQVRNQPHAIVTGTKDMPATITTRDSTGHPNTLVGPRIEYTQATDSATVQGAGQLTGTQPPPSAPAGATRPAPSTAPAARPFTVTWSNGIDYQGAKDRIDINGNVLVTTTDRDGALNTARSKQLTLNLVPATQPSARGATTRKSKSAGDSDVAFMQDKQVRSFTLNQDVRVQSLLNDPVTGDVLRQTNLNSEQATYDQIDKRLTIPRKGTLLLVDLRKPATRPAKAASGNPNAFSPNSRGTTAMSWQKSLVYDELNRQARITGDVRIAHKAPSDAETYTLQAQTVTAELAAPPTTAQAAAAPSADQTPQIKSVTADDNVVFEARGKKIYASHMTFSPATQILIATGTDREPAEVFDPSGSSSAFTRIEYDLKTGQFKSQGARGFIQSR